MSVAEPRRLRGLTAPIVAVLVVAVLASVAPAPAAAAAGPSCSDAAQSKGAAIAAAAACGTPVEIGPDRSEYARVFAEPSGAMTIDTSVAPRWVHRADGSWVDVDTSLRRLPDGSLAPSATLADVRFSGGGTGPFATLNKGGHSFTLSWPTSLPAPVVAGDSATYFGVLSGVDLVVRATDMGFSHVLVVETPQAAANPAVQHVSLKVGGDATVSTTTEGGLQVAAGGTVVATAGRASVWDSTPPDSGAPDGIGMVSPSSAVAPTDAARHAQVAAQVTNGTLTLTPDAKLLTDPGVTFPLFVDPEFSVPQQRFTYATSDNVSWTLSDPKVVSGDLGGPQVWVGLNPTQGRKYRGFMEFPMWDSTYDLRGRHILSATLHGTVDHTYLCTETRPVNFYRSNAISSTPRQNWPGPGLGPLLGSVSLRANEQSCSYPNVSFDMTGGGALAADLQVAAGQWWSTYTVGMVSANEGSTQYWMRFFRDSFRLLVTFNSAPNPPADLDTAGKGCVSGASRPFIATAIPALKTLVSDPDGDVDLYTEYAWDRWNPTTSAWDRIGAGSKANLRSGSTSTLTLGVDPGTGAALENGRRYRWAVRVLDPWPGGADSSPWSVWCEFEVETSVPSKPPVVSSPLYLQDGEFHGAVGLTADFTFNGDPSDSPDVHVAGFLWGWSDPPTTFAAAPAAGAALTIPLTPPPPDPGKPTDGGLLTLYVQSVNQAGTAGPRKDYDFLIFSATDPVGEWNLADPVGSTSLADSSGNGRPASAANVTTGVAGRLLPGPGKTAPTVASFNGTTSQAATAGPSVDTSRSFSVSAWVQAGANSNGWRGIVSATGNRASAFVLGRSETNRWTLTTAATDTDGAPLTQLPGTSTSTVEAWTHLVGVYDAGAGKLRLYINGELNASTNVSRIFSANSSTIIGRDKWDGKPDFHAPWLGAIAEVKVWDRVLSDAEVAPMAANAVGLWGLDGSGFDDSVWGRNAAPTPTVSWTTDRAGNAGSAAAVNGVDAALSTAGPVVRTDQSFTVSAWVKLSGKGYQSIVSQDGTNFGAFYLIYDPPSDRWAVTMTTADVNPGWQPVFSNGLAQLNRWTHLAAVYDSSARWLRLYVDGQLQDTRVNTTAWHARSKLRIATNMHNQFVNGAVDDVRVYAGALPGSEIAKLYAG